ncbi:hypothetical protein UlMin_007477 [Ulmus minor]
MLALEVKNAILKKIKEAKYFFIMLDCTLDVSPQEQMSLIIRFGDISTSPIRIEEYFLGFLNLTSNDPKIKSEAKCLAIYELEDFEFLLGMTIWYDIFGDMRIDVAIDQLMGLLSFFENYRKNRFASAMISAKEIANKMKVEPKFCEKCVIHRKKQFDENIGDDTIQSVEEYFRIDYFIYTVYQVICSLKSRFEQFEQYEKIFGLLFNFKKLKSLDEDVLKMYCLNLKEFLKYDEISDVNGLDLFSELKVLREIFQKENNSPIEQLHFIKKVDFFSNECIAYRILLTIHVTVVFAERSFSKLIKSYLRSTMLQERLN